MREVDVRESERERVRAVGEGEGAEDGRAKKKRKKKASGNPSLRDAQPANHCRQVGRRVLYPRNTKGIANHPAAYKS